MKKEKIVLVGGGGHCKVVIDAIRSFGKYEIAGIVDQRLKKGHRILGVPVLGDDNALPAIHKSKVRNAFITVGSVGDCGLRKELYIKVRKLKFNFPVIRHKDTVVPEDVKKNIGFGTFMAAGVVINPGTTIGDNVIINTSVSVDHDCEIGDFVHIAPGVTLSGGVKVGEETHIGTGTNVCQYASIGSRQKIRAGSLVYKDRQGETQISELKHGSGAGTEYV